MFVTFVKSVLQVSILSALFCLRVYHVVNLCQLVIFDLQADAIHELTSMDCQPGVHPVAQRVGSHEAAGGSLARNGRG